MTYRRLPAAPLVFDIGVGLGLGVGLGIGVGLGDGLGAITVQSVLVTNPPELEDDPAHVMKLLNSS